jgi:hypothetical protein
VSFDVEGAFNGAHTRVLTQRLAERRVPNPIVEWIGDFVSNRHARVTVGEYESEVSEIEYAGIPQGSLLSPLLHVFANLYHTILNEDVPVVPIRCFHLPHMQAPRVIVQAMCELMP